MAATSPSTGAGANCAELAFAVSTYAGEKPSTSSLTAENARRIVTQFNHAKFPESTSHNWVMTTAPAAQVATGCGKKSNTGTTSCTTWFASTSIRCNGRGRWWKNQLKGPGIGWVSW